MKSTIKKKRSYSKSFKIWLNFLKKIVKSAINGEDFTKNWIKDLVKKLPKYGTIYFTVFQLVALNYELKLGSAIAERNSVESLITGGQLALAIRGLARAQNETVPTKPSFFYPWTWIPFFQKSSFRARLHEETVVALKEYTNTLFYGENYRLNLSKADLSKAFLDEADLAYALLFKTKMNDVKLNSANLTGAALDSADLTNACLNGARLEKAKLYEATLKKAKLNNANLSNANLEKANLYKCELKSAIVNKANFYEANLSYAIINDLRSWRNILSIKNANIKHVKFSSSNPNDNALGFREWATSFEQGAVEMEVEKWKKWCEKGSQQPDSSKWDDWKHDKFRTTDEGELDVKYK